MSKKEMLISMVRNEGVLLMELVKYLEANESLKSAAFALCENRLYDTVKSLKKARRIAIDELVNETLWCGDLVG